MKDYNSFIIPQSHLDYFYKEKRALYRYKYFKKYGKFPTEEQVKDFTIPKEEIESFKQMVYAKCCENGYPTTPNIPNEDSNNNYENDDYISGNTNEIICTYNVNTSGDTILYRYSPNETNIIEKIIYNSETIIPTSSYDGYSKYNFNKLGDVTVKYVLKENITSIENLYFGNTRITEIVIPSCITSIQKNSNLYSTKLFDYDNVNKVFLTKITCLSKIAPQLNSPILEYSYGDSNFKKGTLFVPKGYSLSYSSWMGDGKTDLYLAYYKWDIKELDC